MNDFLLLILRNLSTPESLCDSRITFSLSLSFPNKVLFSSLILGLFNLYKLVLPTDSSDVYPITARLLHYP
ncbi:hypothetical protein ACTXT7_002794 [Hymenolepis weldensis]